MDSTPEGNRKHAVPGEEPDLFSNPLEVPCVRRTGLWTIATSSAAFLLRFYSTRSVPKALNIMVPLGVVSATVTWITCRREWFQKHETLKTVQQIRELHPKVQRLYSLGDSPEDEEEKNAIRAEVYGKLMHLRELGFDFDDDGIDESTRAALKKVEDDMRPRSQSQTQQQPDERGAV